MSNYKVPQAGWLKTTEIQCLIVLEAKSPRSAGLVPSEGEVIPLSQQLVMDGRASSEYSL